MSVNPIAPLIKELLQSSLPKLQKSGDLENVKNSESAPAKQALAASKPQKAAAAQKSEPTEHPQNRTQNTHNTLTPLHIPLNLAGINTTAEIYVFDDSKEAQRKADPANSTLFLSLKTANFGQIETIIKVIGKNLECEFCVGESSGAEMFRSSMPELVNSLSALGYNLTRSVVRETDSPRNVKEIERDCRDFAARFCFEMRV